MSELNQLILSLLFTVCLCVNNNGHCYIFIFFIQGYYSHKLKQILTMH